MNVVYKYNNDFKNLKTAVCLGNFDGIHIGHKKIIETLVNEAKNKKLVSMAYSFDEHTLNVINGNIKNKLIINNKEKSELMEKLGLDYLYLENFTEEFTRIEPEAFVRDILCGKLSAKLIVVGFDYKFGFKGAGNIELLKELSKKYGFELIVVPAFKMENEVVSSTIIRKYINDGQMDKVEKLLGRTFSINGIVERGKQLGKIIGIPTANIKQQRNHIVPCWGTYATRTKIDNIMFSSITNIGTNPTFEDDEQVKIETNIFDFSKDIYGREIEIFFVKKIKSEKKFNTAEELVSQIYLDISDAKRILVLEDGNIIKNVPINNQKLDKF